MRTARRILGFSGESPVYPRRVPDVPLADSPRISGWVATLTLLQYVTVAGARARRRSVYVLVVGMLLGCGSVTKNVRVGVTVAYITLLQPPGSARIVDGVTFPGDDFKILQTLQMAQHSGAGKTRGVYNLTGSQRSSRQA